ncbi:ABC-2 type transporter [Phytophthora cactorum]|nr:ABC-2 type transporter [Phytophthora cactorum]
MANFTQLIHVTFKVKTKNNESKCKEKIILNDISGSARPGQLLSWKKLSTGCISGPKDIRDGLEGTITVNGQPWTKQFKQQTSYVVQDDLFYETITVCTNTDGFKNDRLGRIVQLRVVLSRNVLGLFRDKTPFHAEVGQSLVVSILMGLLYLQLDMSFSGAFFYFMANEIFAAVEIQFASLPFEITMIRREYEAGLFYLASWYVARNLSDLPMQILLPFIVFLQCLLVLQTMTILSCSASVGLAYAISCLFRRANVATIMGMFILLPMLLLGVSWSTRRYARVDQLHFTNQVRVRCDDEDFLDEVSTIPCNEGTENCIAPSGQQVLENYSISTRSVVLDGVLLLA